MMTKTAIEQPTLEPNPVRFFDQLVATQASAMLDAGLGTANIRIVNSPTPEEIVNEASRRRNGVKGFNGTGVPSRRHRQELTRLGRGFHDERLVESVLRSREHGSGKRLRFRA